ncbi:MAG: cytochrome c oxidase subunit 2 [Bryobacteraceae bacterium]|nr:MAG: cytochrome c oxidase subunit 2 [Bryobacteraceae bacterium]
MNWFRDFLLPRGASTLVGETDGLFLFITLLTVFFFFFNGALILYAVKRWRRRSEKEVTPHITHDTRLELVWSLIPLVVVMLIFFWGFRGYVKAWVAPNESMEIIVTGKKWVWEFEYPDGTRTLNDLHVPVNQPVKLVLTAEDVIHSFYIPEFRLKRDAIPGRYTELWFTATKPGIYQVFCAEYCGKGHSDMLARIFVDTPEQYETFLREGDEQVRKMPLKELGRLVWENKGCATCHSLDGTRGQGPSWKGIWGHKQRGADGKEYQVDADYIRQSILAPQAVVVEGYQPIMPTYQGLLREREILGVIEFIKDLQ